jgi:hypothetical protein
MKNAPTPTSWRNPTMIAAIIGAVAVILAAIIGLVPKTKPQETTRIEQQTSGAESPAIADVKGNVTITPTPPAEKQP